MIACDRKTAPSSAIVSIFEGAIATNHLTTAYRALFSITARHVKFTLYDSAIMTSMFVRTPIICFAAVSNTANRFSVDRARGNELSCFNLFGPILGHWHAAIQNTLGFSHGLEADFTQWRCILVT